jgi:tetratricopeptide (TPR) repeat protein
MWKLLFLILSLVAQVPSQPLAWASSSSNEAKAGAAAAGSTKEKNDDHDSEHKDDPSAKAESKPESESGRALVEKLSCEHLPQKSSKDLWNLAECFEKIGDYFRAVGSLREISRRDPRDLESYFVSAWLLWRDGRKQGGAAQSKKNTEAIDELLKARLSNPTHWRVDAEIGDFYHLRLGNVPQAYAEYLKARDHYPGDYARNVPEASLGMKVSIENRIARATEALDRKGESVEASCRALYYDPDDKDARQRIERLSGSCTRKGVQDPLKANDKEKSGKESEDIPPL